MEIYEAMSRRRSIRNYSGDTLSKEKLDKVKEFVGKSGKYHDRVSVDAKLVEAGRRFQKDISGVIADYGKVKAPHYLVLTSNGGDRGLVELGYRYEFVVLALTSMRVGTCWIGKGFNDAELEGYIDIPTDQSPKALIAFGPVPDQKLEEIEEPKRKDLDAFLIEKGEDDIDRKTTEVIDALRRAPSSINSQPWRVLVEEKRLHLYIKPRTILTRKLMESLSDMNRIDAGIGLRHMQVAGNYFWENVAVKHSDHPKKRKLEYIASIVR